MSEEGTDIENRIVMRTAIQNEVERLDKTLTLILDALKKIEEAAIQNGSFELAQFKTAFLECKKKLDKASEQIAELETGVSVYKELAEKWKRDKEEFQDRITTLEADVSLLRSTVDNSDD